MRIGIDISSVAGEKTGIGNNTTNLITQLARIDKINQYILYPSFYRSFHREFTKAAVPRQSNFHIRFEKLPQRLMNGLWYSPIPGRWILGDVDILHSTAFYAPKNHPGKLVVTIHDISSLTLPHYHTEATRKRSNHGTENAVAYADHIITVSEFSKNELLRYFTLEPEKITVTHSAAKDIFVPCSPEEKKRVREKYGVPEDFILFVGSLEPRKNVATLVRAYISLPEPVRKRHRLVIAGGKGWLNAEIDTLLKSSGSSGILRIGYVDEQDLPALYSAAIVSVFPSLYEGFGLPVLEAMACGTPVISSNSSSLPEVGGDAALYFDPHDTNQLKETLERLLGDENLRAQLSRKGIERARLFSWEKAAQETLGVYEKVYRNK